MIRQHCYLVFSRRSHIIELLLPLSGHQLTLPRSQPPGKIYHTTICCCCCCRTLKDLLYLVDFHQDLKFLNSSNFSIREMMLTLHLLEMVILNEHVTATTCIDCNFPQICVLVPICDILQLHSWSKINRY